MALAQAVAYDRKASSPACSDKHRLPHPKLVAPLDRPLNTILTMYVH